MVDILFGELKMDVILRDYEMLGLVRCGLRGCELLDVLGKYGADAALRKCMEGAALRIMMWMLSCRVWIEYIPTENAVGFTFRV